MQVEFVSATLRLTLKRSWLVIERPRDSEQVIVQWEINGERSQANIPARKADGEVIPGTGVEHLSDLIFWLSEIVPPRVRTSKVKEESDSRRLSFRDLFWYCYLDQESMDSSFFYLEEHAHPFKQLKSRDVIRYVIGFHDERVAELEGQIDALRSERLVLSSSAASIVRVLKEVGVDSEDQIRRRASGLRERAAKIEEDIVQAKAQSRSTATAHASEHLRAEAVSLGEEIARIDAAIADLAKSLDSDTRHVNEIETLSLKFKRSTSAKAVLSGVVFVCCPRCAQSLPERGTSVCRVCGQQDQVVTPDSTEEAIIDRDIKTRAAELREIIGRHTDQQDSLKRDRVLKASKKQRIEAERNEASSEYDTAYLSTYLAKERERAALNQEAEGLASLAKMAGIVQQHYRDIESIEGRQRDLRAQLRDARQAAESDAANLTRLRTTYLDCLVRTGVPGINGEDQVQIPTKDFFPFITGDTELNQTTSFANISSGGKKNLLKLCYAVALHRVAASLKAPLPEFLLIDSAMKNISERENREQFENFYQMLFDLKVGELSGTQFVIIDKEYHAPPAELKINHSSRQMRPNDNAGATEFPPFITKYTGK